MAQHEPHSLEWEVNFRPPGLPPGSSEDAILKVATGDFDGDGRDDGAAWRSSSQELLIYRSREDGSFEEPQVHKIPSLALGAWGDGLVASDLNGDGRDDLALSTHQGVRILVSQSGGGWRWTSQPGDGRQPHAALVLWDANGDGHEDIFVQEILSEDGFAMGRPRLYVYLGDGAGGVSEVLDIPTPGYFVKMALVDVSGDGLADLVALESTHPATGAGKLVVRHGKGGLGFGSPVVVSSLAHGSFAAGDFNDDGRLDIATDRGYAGVLRQDSRVLVFSQDASGRLMEDPAQTRWIWEQAGDFLATDLDADGKDDLVSVHNAVTMMSYQLQRDGRLGRTQLAQTSSTVMHAIPYYPGSLAAGDFNGDGRPEILLGNFYQGVGRMRNLYVPYTGTARLPGAPRVMSTSLTDTIAYVGFARPEDDGGAPILGYSLEVDPPGPFDLARFLLDPDGPEEASSVMGLDYGVEYRVRVRARNEAGWGPPSAPSKPFTPVEIPTFRIADGSIEEGDDGSRQLVFRIETGSPVLDGGITFDMSTADDTAIAGEDYVARESRDVRIPEGATGLDYPVTILGDRAIETTERFLLVAENVRGNHSADPGHLVTGFGRIVNDDEDPSVAFLNVMAAEIDEGNSGTRELRVEVALSRPLATPVTFDIATAYTGPGPYSAEPGEDYVDRLLKDVVIPAGEQAYQFAVGIPGDANVEYNEQFMVRATNVRGATPVALEARMVVLNDDFGGMPPLHLREDRYLTSENAPTLVLDSLANDIFTASRLSSSMSLSGHEEAMQQVSIAGEGTPSPQDDRWHADVRADYSGDAYFRYGLCETSQRCRFADVRLVVRPIPEADLVLDVDADRGFRDILVQRLRALPEARFEASALVPMEISDVLLGIDPDPLSPWDGGGAGTRTIAGAADAPAGATARRLRVLADATLATAGDVDLYMGLDVNADGQASPDELACTSAMSEESESCELAFTQAPGEPARYWMMLHNRGTVAITPRLASAVVDLESRDDKLVATGPGHLDHGEAFSLRLAWDDPGLLPGESRVAYLAVLADPETEVGVVPVRIHRAEGEPAPRILVPGVEQRLRLEGGDSHPGMFLDVPEGATRLRVSSRSGDEIDLAVSRRDWDPGPMVAEAPAVPLLRSEAPGGNDELILDASHLVPGRWYVTPVNQGLAPASMVLRVEMDAMAPAPAPGSYFNPDRSGHGLFIYPAGDQWAALWYTYLQDRTPTWYYLQAARADSSGVWRAPIYRASWDGAANHLVPVGLATMTPTPTGGFRFSYTLDGETGSENFQALGSGCPSLGGRPLDASSHWFNPARAGTGYSVQLFPNYELHMAFVYDAQGVPRFLTAERSGFGGAESVLALEQLEGFCPLCPRTGAPSRQDIGTYLRRYLPAGFEVAMDGFFVKGAPGYWTVDESLLLLGGPGTTQGCR